MSVETNSAITIRVDLDCQEAFLKYETSMVMLVCSICVVAEFEAIRRMASFEPPVVDEWKESNWVLQKLIIDYLTKFKAQGFIPGSLGGTRGWVATQGGLRREEKFLKRLMAFRSQKMLGLEFTIVLWADAVLPDLVSEWKTEAFSIAVSCAVEETAYARHPRYWDFHFSIKKKIGANDHGNSNSSHVKIFLPKKLLECLPKCSSLPKERHRWNTNEIMLLIHKHPFPGSEDNKGHDDDNSIHLHQLATVLFPYLKMFDTDKQVLYMGRDYGGNDMMIEHNSPMWKSQNIRGEKYKKLQEAKTFNCLEIFAQLYEASVLHPTWSKSVRIDDEIRKLFFSLGRPGKVNCFERVNRNTSAAPMLLLPAIPIRSPKGKVTASHINLYDEWTGIKQMCKEQTQKLLSDSTETITFYSKNKTKETVSCDVGCYRKSHGGWFMLVYNFVCFVCVVLVSFLLREALALEFTTQILTGYYEICIVRLDLAESHHPVPLGKPDTEHPQALVSISNSISFDLSETMNDKASKCLSVLAWHLRILEQHPGKPGKRKLKMLCEQLLRVEGLCKARKRRLFSREAMSWEEEHGGDAVYVQRSFWDREGPLVQLEEERLVLLDGHNWLHFTGLDATEGKELRKMTYKEMLLAPRGWLGPDIIWKFIARKVHLRAAWPWGLSSRDHGSQVNGVCTLSFCMSRVSCMAQNLHVALLSQAGT
ncbi:hypothetical protein HPG69_006975 [Diceros bicornis minor]|uniref:Uncharacterized protein n=1 Tax=Diceros bicornis minor TaxID=77932 RepID=A0A7J7EP26_DICBM|nr:hypothetical protein HPG69_006975 [Diceros bicornis minor]